MSIQKKESIRVMVDMSVTLVHHGHIRLLKKVKTSLSDKNVILVVGLTLDHEVVKYKGYQPELPYEGRKELLEAIEYVDEVVPTPWEITEETITKYNIDFLAHGSDNSNKVKNIIQFPRTEGISSEMLREKALGSIVEQRNSRKPMFTSGPSNVSLYNLLDIRGVFGRDDKEYQDIEKTVLNNILPLTGHDHIVCMQGSATTAIDVATTNLVVGDVLVVVSGYYSKRLAEIFERNKELLPNCSVTIIDYSDIKKELKKDGKFDWVATAYVETSDGFLSDIHLLRELANVKQAKLFLDATASINLEEHHELADACAFSSCKGLGGLTGAGFITYKEGCLANIDQGKLPWSLDINTYINKVATGPYHAICSLYTISKDFNRIRSNVQKSKEIFIAKYTDMVVRKKEDQPQLCTVLYSDKLSVKKGVAYTPREAVNGQAVVCHLGDMFTEDQRIGDLYGNLLVEPALLEK